jgi:hypothetical protein
MDERERERGAMENGLLRWSEDQRLDEGLVRLVEKPADFG